MVSLDSSFDYTLLCLVLETVLLKHADMCMLLPRHSVPVTVHHGDAQDDSFATIC